MIGVGTGASAKPSAPASSETNSERSAVGAAEKTTSSAGRRGTTSRASIARIASSAEGCSSTSNAWTLSEGSAGSGSGSTGSSSISSSGRATTIAGASTYSGGWYAAGGTTGGASGASSSSFPFLPHLLGAFSLAGLGAFSRFARGAFLAPAPIIALMRSTSFLKHSGHLKTSPVSATHSGQTPFPHSRHLPTILRSGCLSQFKFTTPLKKLAIMLFTHKNLVRFASSMSGFLGHRGKHHSLLCLNFTTCK